MFNIHLQPQIENCKRWKKWDEHNCLFGHGNADASAAGVQDLASPTQDDRMRNTFRRQLPSWIANTLLALLIGYAANALIGTTLVAVDGFNALPSLIVEYGGLVSLFLTSLVSLIWLSRISAPKTRYADGLRLAGLLFLSVIAPFLTLLIVDGAKRNPGSDGVAGAVILMTVVVTLWYGVTGGCLLFLSRIISRSQARHDI